MKYTKDMLLCWVGVDSLGLVSGDWWLLGTVQKGEKAYKCCGIPPHPKGPGAGRGSLFRHTPYICTRVLCASYEGRSIPDVRKAHPPLLAACATGVLLQQWFSDLSRSLASPIPLACWSGLLPEEAGPAQIGASLPKKDHSGMQNGVSTWYPSLSSSRAVGF